MFSSNQNLFFTETNEQQFFPRIYRLLKTYNTEKKLTLNSFIRVPSDVEAFSIISSLKKKIFLLYKSHKFLER